MKRPRFDLPHTPTSFTRLFCKKKKYNCSYNPTFLRIYSRELETLGVSLPFEESEGSYELYSGDAAVSRKGELLIWQPVG